MRVLARHQLGQFLAVRRHAPALRQRGRQGHASRLVLQVAGPFGLGRRALAQVVAQRGVTHRQRRIDARTFRQHQQQVSAGVDLRVMRLGLRDAEQPRQLRRDARQRAAIAQDLDHPRRMPLHQPPGELLPDAFGDQRIGLAGVHHAAHQRHGFRRDREVPEARREAGQAQDPHRILGEGRRHVAQDPCREIPLAAIGVDQRTVLGPGHRVDGQVPARQVLFEGDVRVGMELETVVSGSGLALGPGQCHLFMGHGVQEHREILADRLKSLVDQGLGRGSDHHPITVLDRQAQQGVPDGTPDEIHLITHVAAQHPQAVGCSFRLCLRIFTNATCTPVSVQTDQLPRETVVARQVGQAVGSL